MGQHVHIQRSFAGGEIGPGMLMRQDHEFYKESALLMLNFMPGTTGSAVRAPGTRYLIDTGENNKARIIPFLNTANEKCILQLRTVGSQVRLYRNIDDWITEGTVGMPPDPASGTVIYRRQEVPNGDFRGTLDPWVVNPEKYPAANDDGDLGVWYENGKMVIKPRLYKFPNKEYDTCTAEGQCTVDYATDAVTIDFSARYGSNPPINEGGFTLTMVVSKNADYSSPIWTKTYDETDFPYAGPTIEPGPENASVGTGWTGTLYFKITLVAEATADRQYSNPQFYFDYFHIFANAETTVSFEDLTHPYADTDLDDLHFVQSPYGDKELIIVHPSYAPYKFYFDTGGGIYKFEAITFTNPPTSWGVNNYPATCSSVRGRLVLAGGQSFRITAGALTSDTETVWCTEVGKWSTFTTTPTNPSDSVSFTTIFRSPIQWVMGQKRLLVGALEYEYSADGSQDGLLAPGDVDAQLQGTHGSNNVQPAAFGTAVLFPADGGRKVRSLQYEHEKQSWVAQDLTIYHPTICAPKIKRMVRLRNPRQMCVVLSTAGDLRLFHSESGIEGWSRFETNGGKIMDICVQTDDQGRDVLFLLVKRNINGAVKVYLECIPNFSFESEWEYLDSHLTFNFETPTDTITNLDHLEGQNVQVITGNRFLGSFLVTSGQIVLDDDIGGTYQATTAVVGKHHPCRMYTLPPEKLDPGAVARYVDFAVRCVGSTRPIINGERPADRDPLNPIGRSQKLDYLKDTAVTVRGLDPYSLIEIYEQIPKRVEVLGIYGTLESNRV